jgi:hypothetical protein
MTTPVIYSRVVEILRELSATSIMGVTLGTESRLGVCEFSILVATVCVMGYNIECGNDCGLMSLSSPADEITCASI